LIYFNLEKKASLLVLQISHHVTPLLSKYTYCKY